jgi:ABC-2 type transport system ATP-binding protein
MGEIATHGLTKTFKERIAVDGISLEVGRGETFGLLGPNGAGKTTTVGMLTTRVRPTAGTAVVGGIDVVDRPTEAKRRIGVVTQTNTLDRSLDVWQNLFFHGRYFGMSAKRARDESNRLLEQFRLSDRRSAPVATLSGGMAQRLMLARAVLHRPEVLFLDEPTAGLDPQSRIALWEMIGQLHDAGQTVLLTTHYMEEADELCDRLAIIDHGHVIALDTPQSLKRSIGIDATVAVIATGDLEGLADRLSAEIADVAGAHVAGDSLQLTVRDRRGIVPAVARAAEAVDVTLTDISVTETTLESVFISLTGRELRE